MMQKWSIFILLLLAGCVGRVSWIQPPTATIALSLSQIVDAELDPLRVWECRGMVLNQVEAAQAYNARLPFALAALVSDEQAQGLSLAELKTFFEDGEPAQVWLYENERGDLLVEVWGVNCPIGSHDRGGLTQLYVMDRQGHYWQVGEVNRLGFPPQWVEDRWIVIADQAPAIYNPPSDYFIWQIAFDGIEWGVSYSARLWEDQPEWITLTDLVFEEGYRKFTASFSYPSQSVPCRAIAENENLYLIWIDTERTYRWDGTHYALRIEKRTPRLIFRYDPPPPYPAPPFGEVKHWQDLCEN